jgi:hypothetical protein
VKRANGDINHSLTKSVLCHNVTATWRYAPAFFAGLDRLGQTLSNTTLLDTTLSNTTFSDTSLLNTICYLSPICSNTTFWIPPLYITLSTPPSSLI